jgi:hypothetical protein
MTVAEAKATFARVVAANSSLAAIVAIVELLFDKVGAAIEADQLELEKRRAEDEIARVQDAARKRIKRASGGCPADIRRASADAACSRARSSSSSSLRSELIDDDDGDARERARNTDEKMGLKVVAPAADPDQLASDIEQIVKEKGLSRSHR